MKREREKEREKEKEGEEKAALGWTDGTVGTRQVTHKKTGKLAVYTSSPSRSRILDVAAGVSGVILLTNTPLIAERH